MTVRPNRNWAYVVVACIATCMSSRAEQPFQAVDPGVRLGYANAGTVVRGVDAGYFANTRFAFQEVQCRELILHFLVGGEHSLFILREGPTIPRLCLLDAGL